MVLVLSAITLISSTAVGVVYQLTKNPIKEANIKKFNKTVLSVLPEFEKLAKATIVDIDGESVSVYPAVNQGEVIGYAVESFSKNGFSGMVKVLVGFKADGTIHSSAVVAHAETPGLGDKMERTKSNFSTQFDGANLQKSNLKVKKEGGDIDAITAATISSKAYIDAISNAYKAYKQVVEK